jgi:hypothetical protein
MSAVDKASASAHVYQTVRERKSPPGPRGTCPRPRCKLMNACSLTHHVDVIRRPFGFGWEHCPYCVQGAPRVPACLTLDMERLHSGHTLGERLGVRNQVGQI